jgi:hypothetical protein
MNGVLKDKNNTVGIYKCFLNNKLCELIAKQINISAQQKINAKTMRNTMERSQGKDWVITTKVEINSFLWNHCCKALCRN